MLVSKLARPLLARPLTRRFLSAAVRAPITRALPALEERLAHNPCPPQPAAMRTEAPITTNPE